MKIQQQLYQMEKMKNINSILNCLLQEIRMYEKKKKVLEASNSITDSIPSKREDQILKLQNNPLFLFLIK